jgi:hypothetical protein
MESDGAGVLPTAGTPCAGVDGNAAPAADEKCLQCAARWRSVLMFWATLATSP